MKVFVVIGIAAVLLLSSFLAEASPALLNNNLPCQQKKQNKFAAAKPGQPLAGKDNEPHRHFFHVSRLEKKLRQHSSPAIQPVQLLLISSAYTGFPIQYNSPSYLPLQRLLLFPNHYFW
ncbi:hypothetical protein HRG84_06330 [Flavisolibacter sp. BT320]|nr:hypothetical protein [Flavisolibacter longurius]